MFLCAERDKSRRFVLAMSTILSIRRVGAAWTLWVGLAMIVVTLVLVLAVDVPLREGAVVPHTLPRDLPPPVTTLQRIARWAAVNITGINWVGYLLVFDGLLTLIRRRDDNGDDEGSPLRQRPNRFIVAWLTSIPVWCFFDWINFYFIQAWDYHGLPPHFASRVVGYFVAFAAISPGMFLTAVLYQRLGVRHLMVNRREITRVLTVLLSLGVLAILILAIVLIGICQNLGGGFLLSTLGLILPGSLTLAITWRLVPAVFVFGLSFTLWAILLADPVSNMALWVGLIYLLDPICHRCGAPSILRDWEQGRYGRTISLMLGGATCGLLWESWNYYAIAKWTYNLPFLGELEHVRYFEMPWLGFLGFLPFAIECWVMLNAIIVGLEQLNLRLAEPLADDHAIM